jgi:predicted CoA-binding protein
VRRSDSAQSSGHESPPAPRLSRHPGQSPCDRVGGVTCYPDLASVPDDVEIEVVDIFRRADAAGKHVDEAIGAGAKAVGMRLGVIDEDSPARAGDADLDVVMDRCPAIELARRNV